MEPKVQTSFIPKKSLQEASSQKSRGVGLFLVITLAIFIITALLAGGVYLYEQFLQDSIVEKNASLERARAAFEPALIEELKRLSSRMTLARGVLNDHVAPSNIFTLLEEATLSTIRFRNFNYVVSGPKATISMRGEARAFADMALQSDVFSATKQFRDPIFTNITLDAANNAVFDFSATLDPSLILYRNQRFSPTPPQVTTPPPAAATTSPGSSL